MALILAAFEGEKDYGLIQGGFQEDPDEMIWRAEEAFYTPLPEGTALSAGDTLGWALDETSWQVLTDWSAATGKEEWTAETVGSQLEKLGLTSWMPRVLRPGRTERPARPPLPGADAASVRIASDSLEQWLHQLRRQWREAEPGMAREELGAAIRQAESQLNRARSERDRLIQAGERRGQTAPRAPETLVDRSMLQYLVDSLLSDRLRFSPDAGILRSQAEWAGGAWYLARSEGCVWIFETEASIPADRVVGSAWTFVSQETGRELRGIVRAMTPDGCQVYLSDCEHGLPSAGRWTLSLSATTQRHSLLRQWLGWHPDYSEKNQQGLPQG